MANLLVQAEGGTASETRVSRRDLFAPPPTATVTPTPAATPILVPTPTELPPTPTIAPIVRLDYSLDTVYYPVTGTTTRAIFDSVKANGPESAEGVETRYATGLAHAESRVELEMAPNGTSCRLESAVISLAVVVTLPEHSNPSSLSDAQLLRWLAFDRDVKNHEQRHVNIYVDGAESFQNRLEELPADASGCDTLNDHIDSMWHLEMGVNDQQQERFHESEARLREKLREPLKQRIDVNKRVLDDLHEELAGTVSDIEDLHARIDGVGRAIDRADARISQIETKHPDLVLPSDTLLEYRLVVGEWNRFNDVLNRLIDQADVAFQKYDRIVENIDQLADVTSEMMDELDWLQ